MKSKKNKQDGNSQARHFFSASFIACWTASMAANFLFVCSSTAILLESKLLQEVGKVHLHCTKKYQTWTSTNGIIWAHTGNTGMPGEKQPQSIWWNPTNSLKERTKCSRKKKLNQQEASGPLLVNNIFYRFLRENFQQSILRSPFATHLICLDLRHSPQIWKPRLLLFRGFSIRPISIFSKQNKGQSGSGASIWYMIYIHTIYASFVCMNLQCTSLYIYIYLYIWPLHTHVLVFFHMSHERLF